MDVGGAINLANATLNVTLNPTFTPATGQQFTILNNTGSGAITGTFAGLPEGAPLTISGQQFTISYKGGTLGNSVVLTAVSETTATWTGGDTGSPNNNDKWSDTANWQGGIVPSTGYDVVFPANLTTSQQTSNNDISNLQLTSILVQDAGFNITGDAVTLSGGIDSSQASSSSTVGLPVTFTHAGTVTVDGTAGTLVLSGAITGSSGLVKQGSGVLELTANSGTLATTVDAGTLLVDNTAGSGGTIGDVAVNPQTTLGGTGTVASISTAGATVSPGDSSTSTGILTDTGPAVLDARSTFVATINGGTVGTEYSQLQAAGTINLTGATLSTTLSSTFTPTPDEQFTIIDNTGTSAITGTFAGLAEGAILKVSGQEFSITYKGGTGSNSVVLTALAATTTTVTPVTTTQVYRRIVRADRHGRGHHLGPRHTDGNHPVHGWNHRPGFARHAELLGHREPDDHQAEHRHQLDHGGLFRRYQLLHQHLAGRHGHGVAGLVDHNGDAEPEPVGCRPECESRGDRHGGQPRRGHADGHRPVLQRYHQPGNG